MGYMRYHAILVSSWDEKRVQHCHEMAEAIFKDVAPVSEIKRSFVNGDVSFAIFPDASKEGWDHSDRGDDARAAFLRFIRAHSQVHEGEEHLTWYVKWAEVMFGDDERLDCLERSSADEALQYDEEAVL
jgi:hypothetical protein